MKIGYNKLWGILFFVLEVPVCCLSAAYVQTGDEFPVALTATFWIFALVGVLFLARTYVKVSSDSVSIKPLIGFGEKIFRIQSARDFSVEGKKVFVVSEGQRQRLPVSSWLVNSGGWTSFIQWIQTSNQPDD